MKTLRLTLLAVPLFLVGCKSIPYVTKDGAAPATPAPDKATIVVAQSYTYPQINIIDPAGKVLGQVGPRQYTVFNVPPGELKMAAFPGKVYDRGDRVAGTVEANKVYYFVVTFRMGGITFQTISPRNDKEEWNQRKTYTRDLSPVSIEPGRAAEVEAALGEERSKYYGEIDSEVNGWTDEEKKNRRIEPGDGDGT
ncbi:MAG: hypothetical protein QM723_06235 [Myxococcaceae bacterium]